MTKEVKAKEPSKEVNTKTIEEQVEALKREIKELSDEAKSCDSEISRETDDQKILVLDQKKRIAMLKKTARENRLKELGAELGKKEKEAAFVRLRGLREERRESLEKGWKLTRQAIKTLGGLWDVYRKIHEAGMALANVEATEDILCKRHGFVADQVLVGGRATITCPGGGHLPQKTHGGYQVWLRALINFGAGKSALYDPSEFEQKMKEEE